MGKDFSNGGHLGRDLKSKEVSYVDVWEKRALGRGKSEGLAIGTGGTLSRQQQRPGFVGLCRAR